MKIVVVNLERSAERRRQVVAGLERLGLAFHIHRAVDWRDLTPEQEALIDVAGTHRDGIRVNLGSIAANLSQRQVLADLVENGPRVIAMLEDDVTFSPEFPAVLDALEETDVPFDIVFLHHGRRARRFVPDARLSTGHRLGWVRWSTFGAQGIVITRSAARRFLARTPEIRPGLDRAFARYWRHGLITYSLRPAVVHHLGVEPGYVSLISTPETIRNGTIPFRRLRRLGYDVREGAGKRLAFSRLVIGAHGPVRGCNEILGLSRSLDP